jgi:hypothetical protein
VLSRSEYALHLGSPLDELRQQSKLALHKHLDGEEDIGEEIQTA